MKRFTHDDNLEALTGAKDWSLLYFSATWCGPCKTMSPVMEQIASDYDDRLLSIKVDVDEAPELAGQYGLRGVPTVLLLNRGKVVDTLVGAQPQQQMTQWLHAHL